LNRGRLSHGVGVVTGQEGLLRVSCFSLGAYFISYRALAKHMCEINEPQTERNRRSSCAAELRS
jgi:hypothetical protein